MTVDVAALRARLDREFAIVPSRPELPALSYGEGFALLDMLDEVKAVVDEIDKHATDPTIRLYYGTKLCNALGLPTMSPTP